VAHVRRRDREWKISNGECRTMKSPLRRVMVPLDGSPLSRQALGVAAEIARREGAALHLVTVIAPLATLASEAGTLAHDDAIEQALHDGFQQHLDQQADAVRRRAPGVPVTCSVLDGDIAGMLAEYARAEDIDLIVMTTHGWGGLKRLWLGSLAEALVHRVHCPTLLLRALAEEPGFGLHRILVALESADDADAILEPALAIGTLVEGAHYRLIQVVQLQPPLLLRIAGIPDHSVRGWVVQIAEEAQCRLDRVAARLRHRGIAADARVLVERGAGEQILSLARQSGSDLIVVGTRAKGLERGVFGSVADKVVRGATQMVLVVPMRVESLREALPNLGEARALAGAAPAG
jgi:nucleotide-binding universal stress UspA family protein